MCICDILYIFMGKYADIKKKKEEKLKSDGIY